MFTFVLYEFLFSFAMNVGLRDRIRKRREEENNDMMLKREYKMLKEAKKQSGAHWNDKMFKIEAEPAIWNNIIHVR